MGFPKRIQKDPVTGKLSNRAEWLRSGNSKIPIRWVIDYRYVNSMSVVAKIPLPLIEELFDRMVGCKYFTLSILLKGTIKWYFCHCVDPIRLSKPTRKRINGA